MHDDARPQNRLGRELSPYLRQHRFNPVDWYPWGEEAFARARSEQKPLLLSIGYAACHWCHVMEHDAFDVPEVAARMNRDFVCVKVDREERPDVDQLYQGVMQLQRRGGGWPLTVFLTPEQRPFFGGTYFPPVDRHGLPGFSRLLASLAEAWRTRRAEVEESARSFQHGLDRLAAFGRPEQADEPPTDAELSTIAAAICDEHDARHGGFFDAPKFPHPMELAFLLRVGTAGEGALQTRAKEVVRRSLTAMARGGIHDVLGGGFARYSVDAAWEVPHFEKMLSDNAQLLRLYAEAAVALDEPTFAEVARGIHGWLRREMVAPSGGLFASQDADSEGVEGKFFVFTTAELREVLGAERAALAARHLGVTEAGNFEHGATVLSLARTPAELSAEGLGTTAALEVELASIRAALFAVRRGRVPPATDDKCVTAWNGLAIGALAVASRLLAAPAMLEDALAAARFVDATLASPDGLLRVAREGQVKQPGFLDDHAALAEGCVELALATGDGGWLARAVSLAHGAIDRFVDEATGALHLTPSDGEALLQRPLSVHDHATPSGGSSLTNALLRLHALTGEARFADVAIRHLAGQRAGLLQSPFAYGHLACAAWLARRGVVEVAIVGGSADARAALEAASGRGLHPERLVWSAAASSAPFHPRGDGREGAAAFVCRAFACSAPVTTPEALGALLAASP